MCEWWIKEREPTLSLLVWKRLEESLEVLYSAENKGYPIQLDHYSKSHLFNVISHRRLPSLPLSFITENCGCAGALQRTLEFMAIILDNSSVNFTRGFQASQIAQKIEIGKKQNLWKLSNKFLNCFAHPKYNFNLYNHFFYLLNMISVSPKKNCETLSSFRKYAQLEFFKL